MSYEVDLDRSRQGDADRLTVALSGPVADNPNWSEIRIDPAALQTAFTSPQVRWSDIGQRNRGSSLDLGWIESAINDTHSGLMTRITDLETETADMDPGMSGALLKRFGRVMVAPIRCEAQCPPGGDMARAKLYAAQMQYAFEQIPLVRKQLRTFAYGLYHGRAAQEIGWERNHYAVANMPAPGVGAVPPLRMVPTSLSWIPARNLSFGPQRELRHINPDHYTSFFTNRVGFALGEHIGKFLYWTPQLFAQQPEREGLGPRCLYWSFFKRFSWKLRMKLTELFGIPWRIIKTMPGAIVGPEALASAARAAEALGADTTAQLSPGVDLDVVLPNGDTGQLFSLTSADVDEQLQMLILGQAGTMKAQATGLGSNTTSELRAEQDQLIIGDFYEASESIQECMLRPMMVANHGYEAAALYTPKFVIDGMPRNRMAELGTKKLVVDMGVPVSMREIREAGGTEEPKEDEQTVGAADTYGFPPVGLPDLPLGPAPAATEGDFELTATDVATIVTVNQALRKMKLPPMPGPDGLLTIAQYQAKNAVTIAAAAAAADGVDPNDPTPAPFGAPPFGGGPPNHPGTPLPTPGPKPSSAPELKPDPGAGGTKPPAGEPVA